MPFEWLRVLAHHTTKDKAALLMRLKYEMTVSDVHDLMEYQDYENLINFEERKKNERQSQRG